ncbi:fumarylacetoacetate hydrolase family protein [Rhizobium sp. BR 314]|uniref:fumarylacetoacetate hydrolase family protein n=1 Tax=Rhizobium sp. BR 314 TaxID=3040013 RepID=UPI0039BFC16A
MRRNKLCHHRAIETPAGVGFKRKSSIFMKAGDRIAVEIEKIGWLENHVVAES